MKFTCSLTALLSCALLLSACSTPTASDVPATPVTTPGTTAPAVSNTLGQGSVRMDGYVREFNASGLLAGSMLTVDGQSGSAATDASGHFVLKLDPGTYNLTLRKSGYGVVRVEGVVVTTAGSVVPLNIVQQQNIHDLAEVPMTMSVSLDDPATGKAYDPASPIDPTRGLLIDATVAAGDSTLSPARFYAGAGSSQPGSAAFGTRLFLPIDPKNTSWTVKGAPLTTAMLHGVRGDTVVQVVAYDIAGNSIQKILPVTIANDGNAAPVPAIVVSSSTAVTLSRSLGYLSVQPDSGTQSVWVRLDWRTAGSAKDISGFHILRSTDGVNFSLLRTIAPSEGTTDFVNYSVRDGTPAVQPGQKLYYAVEPFNATTTLGGPVTSTTPLARFRIQNLSPSDHQNNVSLSPTISFTVSDLVGDYRKFNPLVADYPAQGNGSGLLWNQPGTDFITDQSSDPYAAGLTRSGADYSLKWNFNSKVPTSDGTLQINHTYKLFLNAAAYSADGSAVSVAQDWFYNFDSTETCNSGGPVCDGQLAEFTTGVK